MDGRKVGVGPDRARDLADRDGLAGGLESPVGAFELECPGGELQPEAGRLGPDAVGAAHHHGRLVLEGSALHYVEERSGPVEELIGRGGQDGCLGGVDHV